MNISTHEERTWRHQQQVWQSQTSQTIKALTKGRTQGTQNHTQTHKMLHSLCWINRPERLENTIFFPFQVPTKTSERIENLVDSLNKHQTGQHITKLLFTSHQHDMMILMSKDSSFVLAKRHSDRIDILPIVLQPATHQSQIAFHTHWQHLTLINTPETHSQLVKDLELLDNLSLTGLFADGLCFHMKGNGHILFLDPQEVASQTLPNMPTLSTSTTRNLMPEWFAHCLLSSHDMKILENDFELFTKWIGHCIALGMKNKPLSRESIWPVLQNTMFSTHDGHHRPSLHISGRTWHAQTQARQELKSAFKVMEKHRSGKNQKGDERIPFFQPRNSVVIREIDNAHMLVQLKKRFGSPVPLSV